MKLKPERPNPGTLRRSSHSDPTPNQEREWPPPCVAYCGAAWGPPAPRRMPVASTRRPREYAAGPCAVPLSRPRGGRPGRGPGRAGVAFRRLVAFGGVLWLVWLASAVLVPCPLSGVRRWLGLSGASCVPAVSWRSVVPGASTAGCVLSPGRRAWSFGVVALASVRWSGARSLVCGRSRLVVLALCSSALWAVRARPSFCLLRRRARAGAVVAPARGRPWPLPPVLAAVWSSFGARRALCACLPRGGAGFFSRRPRALFLPEVIKNGPRRTRLARETLRRLSLRSPTAARNRRSSSRITGGPPPGLIVGKVFDPTSWPDVRALAPGWNGPDSSTRLGLPQGGGSRLGLPDRSLAYKPGPAQTLPPTKTPDHPPLHGGLGRPKSGS